MKHMASGRKHDGGPDPLTAWYQAALEILRASQGEVNPKASRENMLALMQALDQRELDAALADEGFMTTTETLLLAMLRGERIEVPNPNTYAARKEIFAAAQVIYNQAVARGLWALHPEIRQAIQEQR
jgi:ABC-type amino acid transport substrate-binding protein